MQIKQGGSQQTSQSEVNEIQLTCVKEGDDQHGAQVIGYRQGGQQDS